MKKYVYIVIPIFIFLIINISFEKQTYVDYRDTSIKYGPRSSNEEVQLYDYINIGSSHAERGIKYPSSVNGINLGFSSQGLYYGLKLLEDFDDKIADNATIIIPLDYASFDSKYDGNIQRYSGYLRESTLVNEMGTGEYIIYAYLPFVGMNNITAMLSKKENANPTNSYDTLHRTTDLDLWQEESLSTVESHYNHTSESHTYYDMLVDYIEKQSDSNRKIILINMPYHESYNENIETLHPDILDTYYDLIDKLVNDYNLTFLDYSISSYSNNIDYFYDDDHLNYVGASDFTEELIKQIELIYNQ